MDRLENIFTHTLQNDSIREIIINNCELLDNISLFQNVSQVSGRLTFWNCENLPSLQFPSLMHAQTMSLLGNGRTVSIDFPNLLTGTRLSITSNASLENINLPKLTAMDRLDIGSNGSLNSLLGLSDSLKVMDLVIENNRSLESCSIPFVCSHLNQGKNAIINQNAEGCYNEANVDLSSISLNA